MRQAQQYQENEGLDNGRAIELQKKLMETWQSRKVQDYYQQIILNYLDRVDPNELEYSIESEIRATHLGQSYYFKLNRKLNQRQKAIKKLEKLINQSKFYNTNQLMPSICEQIQCLRDSNLQCAQTIVQMHRYYGRKQDNLSPHEQEILMNLDQQNAFLKESFLKHYIFFQNGYDPFFLHHYDLRGKKRPASAHPDVEKIFNLTVSYACRLFKTKKQILNIISSGKTNDNISYEAPRKSNPRRIHKLTPNFEQFSNKQQLVNSERDESRKTSVNFRTKPLSLQSAIQRDLLKNGILPKNVDKSLSLKNQKLHTIAQDNSYRQELKPDQNLDLLETPTYKNSLKYSDEDDFDQKIKHRRNASILPIHISDQNLYRLIPVQSSPKRIKPKPVNNHSAQIQSLAQSPNLRVKLEPIATNQPRISPNPQQKINQRKSPSRQNQRKVQIPAQNDSSESEDKPVLLQVKRRRLIQPVKQNENKIKAKKSPEQSSKRLNVSQSAVNKKRQIKMRPGKYTYNELIKYLRGLTLKEKTKAMVFSSKFEQSVSKFQSYFSQFVQGEQLKAVAICLKTVGGPYLIKLWAPLQVCSSQNSLFLFQKYVQYIQKQTKQQQLYYCGQQTQELANLKFVRKKQDIFVRKRIFQAMKKQSDFQLLLSLKCSSIVFSQENYKTNLLYSQQIQPFSKEKAYIYPPFGLIQRNKLSSQLSMLIKINEELQDMKTVNCLLQDQGFDTYQQNSKLKIKNLNVLRFSVNSAFNSPFIVNQGLIRLAGIEIIKTQNQVLYKVPCLKHNIFVYFGKGFANVSKFMQGTQAQGSKMSSFEVKMFNKELYGRLPVQGDDGCYGNWQISLWWQDELQGRVRHQMGSLQCFGTDSYFTGIQIEGKLIYAFQVKKDDLLF